MVLLVGQAMRYAQGSVRIVIGLTALFMRLIMFQQLENVLSAFDFDAEVALEQYLIACELDQVEPDLLVCLQLELLV